MTNREYLLNLLKQTEKFKYCDDVLDFNNTLYKCQLTEHFRGYHRFSDIINGISVDICWEKS